MCTLLVSQTVASLNAVGELAWFLILPSSGDTGCGLSCFSLWVGLVFNVCSYGDTDCVLSHLSQWVGLVFNVHPSGDRNCGLSCFSWWVGLVFNMQSSGDTDCGWSCFRGWVGLGFIVLSCGNIYIDVPFLGGKLLFFLLWITLIAHYLYLIFLVCKLLVFHCIFFCQPIFNIFFSWWVGYIIILIHSIHWFLAFILFIHSKYVVSLACLVSLICYLSFATFHPSLHLVDHYSLSGNQPLINTFQEC